MVLTQRGIDWLAAAMMVAATVVLFVAGLFEPWFETDSWSYLELSNSVFQDFYRYNTVRQFEFHSPYSNSFPPLWPVLMALVNRVFDLGIYSGYVLNFFVCLALLAAMIWLARRLGMPGCVGSLVYCCTLTFPGFITEVLAGRSIPLSLLLLVVTFCLLARPHVSLWHAAAAGACMGLNALTRFDVMLGAAALAAMLFVLMWYIDRRFLRAVLLAVSYTAALVVVLSPWMAFSKRNFGSPLASDNSRQVKIAARGRVADYYHTPPPSDLRINPKAWLMGMLKQKAPVVINRLVFGFLTSALPWLIALVVVAWSPGALGHSVEKARFACLALPLTPLWILPPLLVGYGRERYFIPSFLILSICLLAMLHSFKPELWAHRRVLLLLAIFAAMPVYSDGIDRLYHAHRSLKKGLAPLHPTPEMDQLTEAVKRDAGEAPHRLLFSIHRDAAQYGALTGEPASFMPQIMDGTFADFVRDWQITHAYDPDGKLEKLDKTGVEVVPLGVPNLYRVRVDQQQPAS